jgi:hypothetical protein
MEPANAIRTIPYFDDVLRVLASHDKPSHRYNR